MTASALRVAVVGTGKMGQHHLRAISSTGLATIVGVADPAASAEELQSLLPAGAIVAASLRALCERTKPDVVHIVTPPSTHTALALEAIAAGCHVYIEKPFAPTMAEAARIVDAAAARGVKVCAGHQVLFERPAQGVRDHLAQIGRLVCVESHFSFRMVRRTITPVEQVKDILPHAVYPVVDQLRAATGIVDAPIVIVGASLDASGEVHALLRLGSATGIIVATLNGRPVEQYQYLIGTNGSLRADYIGGFLGKLIGPGTGPGVLLTPYRRALHTLTGATGGIWKLVTGGSYPGLRTLVQRFQESIRDGTPSPITPQSILDSVSICEQLGARLDAVEQTAEAEAERQLLEAEAGLPPVRPDAPVVLLTGGTGLLGRRVAGHLRERGFRVRVVARRVPLFSRRVPGVEYVAGDLARGLDATAFAGVSFVIHAAAETSGGREDHRRNSIEATRKLLEGAARAGVRGVVHVSSLAVLRTSREMGHALDESTPVAAGTLERGPYVWGKAESEVLAQQLGRDLGIPVRIVRPGPLVDYSSFHPPGRLGREIGPVFVAVGPRRGTLSVCDVTTAAKVIRSYLEDFDQAPAVLNMVESPPPTRQELMDRYRADRPDLRVLWCPAWLLRALSGPLRFAQRVALKSKDPVDVAAAFASERYRTDLAAQVIARAESGSAKSPTVPAGVKEAVS